MMMITFLPPDDKRLHIHTTITTSHFRRTVTAMFVLRHSACQGYQCQRPTVLLLRYPSPSVAKVAKGNTVVESNGVL